MRLARNSPALAPPRRKKSPGENKGLFRSPSYFSLPGWNFFSGTPVSGLYPGAVGCGPNQRPGMSSIKAPRIKRGWVLWFGPKSGASAGSKSPPPLFGRPLRFIWRFPHPMRLFIKIAIWGFVGLSWSRFPSNGPLFPLWGWRRDAGLFRSLWVTPLAFWCPGRPRVERGLDEVFHYRFPH